MLTELHAKSQITIPKELVDRLGLSEGDKLDIYEHDGLISIMPVAVYPNDYVEKTLEGRGRNKGKSGFRGTGYF